MVDSGDGLGELCELSSRLTLNTSIGSIDELDKPKLTGVHSSDVSVSGSENESTSISTTTDISSITVTPVETQFTGLPMEANSEVERAHGGEGHKPKQAQPVVTTNDYKKPHNPDEVFLSDSESEGEATVEQTTSSTESSIKQSNDITAASPGPSANSSGAKTTTKIASLEPLQGKPILPMAFGMQARDDDAPNGGKEPLASSNPGNGLGSSKASIYHAQGPPKGPASRYVSVPAFGAPLPFQAPRQGYYGQRSPNPNPYAFRDQHRDQAARDYAQLQKAREELRAERKAHQHTRTTLEAEMRETSEVAMASMLTDVFCKHREVEKMSLEQAKKDVELASREKLIEANERFLNAGQRHFFDRREHREHIPAVDLIFDQAREEGLILGRAEADEAVANLKHQERLNELQQEENDLRQNMWVLHNKEILEAQLRSDLEQEMQGQIDTASYEQGLTDGMKNGHEDGRKQGFLEGFRAASESFAHVAALHHGIALPQARVAPTENFLQRFPVPDKGHVDSQALINKSDNATASEDWEKKNGLAGNGHLSDERPKPVAEAAVPGPPVDLFNTTTVDKGYKNLQRPNTMASISTPSLTQELAAHAVNYHNGREILANHSAVTTNGHANDVMMRQSGDDVFVNGSSRENGGHGSNGHPAHASITNTNPAPINLDVPTRRGRGRFQDSPDHSSGPRLAYEDAPATPSPVGRVGAHAFGRGPLVNPVDGRVQVSYEDLEDDDFGGEVREVRTVERHTSLQATNKLITNGHADVDAAPKQKVVDLMDL